MSSDQHSSTNVPAEGASGLVLASSPEASGGSPLAGERRRLRRRSAALVELLADDSPNVLRQVRAEITRLGRIARPALLRGTRLERPRERSRARQLLLEAGRRRALRRLIGYALRPQHDLETSLSLLDAYGWPEADLRPYRLALDAMGEEVRRRMLRRRPGLRQGLTLAEYLGSELGFAGPGEDYHHPDNISLSHTVARKRGLPLTLCAVYAAVGRRAGIESRLLPFPGHVLLRIEHEGERAIIDPFGGGRVLTERKCLAYLASHGLPYRAEWFQPASDSILFARQLRNLMSSHRARRHFQLARALGGVLSCLENGRPELRRGLKRIR